MKVKWTKKLPKGSGWYWVSYTDRMGLEVVCPAFVGIYGGPVPGVSIETACGDHFVEGPLNGGRGLKLKCGTCHELKEYNPPKSPFEFGPRIEEPG